jgi:signal transduction histidine kinase
MPPLTADTIERRRFRPSAGAADHGRAAGDGELERLGLMTASVAHDFNNLLSVILVCAGEIADAAQDAEQRARAEEIREAAERGAGLSRRLLDQEAPDRDELPPLAVDATVIDALPLLRRTLGAAIGVTLGSDGGTPRVRVAPGEIERMLINLAANSRDAMAGSGTVSIRTALVPIPPGDPILPVGWCARITFTDDGTGMSPEVASKAALAYFSTKEEGQGTGLGLATVQAIARSRGGDMRLNTTHGVGTTVSIYLPAVRETGDSLALRPPAALGSA